MPKLYELTNDLSTVEAWLTEAEDDVIAGGGEIPPHIAELLAGAEASFSAKVDGIVRVMRNFEADADALKAEKSRIAKRQSAAEKRVEWLRGYLKRNLEAANLPKLKTTLATLSIRENAPTYALAAGLDAEAVYNDPTHPASQFVAREESVAFRLNVDAVKAALEDEESLPASIVELKTTSISIR